jgi:hypothetical protein
MGRTTGDGESADEHTETPMSEQQGGARTLERGPVSTAMEEPVLTWLRAEFPDWDVRIERTTTVDGQDRPLWIALRDGHHPQSELTAAKLHSRLADYLDREGRRHPSRN